MYTCTVDKIFLTFMQVLHIHYFFQQTLIARLWSTRVVLTCLSRIMTWSLAHILAKTDRKNDKAIYRHTSGRQSRRHRHRWSCHRSAPAYKCHRSGTDRRNTDRLKQKANWTRVWRAQAHHERTECARTERMIMNVWLKQIMNVWLKQIRNVRNIQIIQIMDLRYALKPDMTLQLEDLLILVDVLHFKQRIYQYFTSW